MSGVLANVDLRTRLAGRNRLALLLFRLDSKQPLAINVFQVQYVIECPPLTQLQESHPVVRRSPAYAVEPSRSWIGAR